MILLRGKNEELRRARSHTWSWRAQAREAVQEKFLHYSRVAWIVFVDRDGEELWLWRFLGEGFK